MHTNAFNFNDSMLFPFWIAPIATVDGQVISYSLSLNKASDKILVYLRFEIFYDNIQLKTYSWDVFKRIGLSNWF